MRRCLLVLVAMAAMVPAAVQADDAQKDAGKLEGTWVATLWKRGDGEVSKDQLDSELVITKDAYEFPRGINIISKKGSLKIDPAKGTIDFTPEDGLAKGKTLLGIYKVEGDTLTLCFTIPGQQRPKEFKSAERTIVLATYERKKK